MAATWDDEYYVLAYARACAGDDDEEIAEALGVAPITLALWRNQRPALDAAIDRGRESQQALRPFDVSGWPILSGEQPGPPHSQRTAADMRKFLFAYSKTGSMHKATMQSGTNLQSPYNWRNGDGPLYEEFRSAFEYARRAAAAMLLDEARRRALEGVRDYQFDRGRPIMVDCDAYHPDARRWGENIDGTPRFARHYYKVILSDKLLAQLLVAHAARIEDAQFKESIEHKHDHQHSGDVMHHLATAAEVARTKPVIDASYVRRLAEQDT